MAQYLSTDLQKIAEAIENLNGTVKQLLEFLKTEEIHVRMKSKYEM